MQPPAFPLPEARTGSHLAVSEFVNTGRNIDDPLPLHKRGVSWSPLQLAAAEGRLGMVVALLDSGADALAGAPDSQYQSSSGPLLWRKCRACMCALNRTKHMRIATVHIAARYGHAPVLSALLAAGADPNSPDTQGFGLSAVCAAIVICAPVPT